MPEFLKETYGLTYAPILIPLLHIVFILFFSWMLLKIIDSALRRLRALIPHGDAFGLNRTEQRAETLRHIIRSVAKFVLSIFAMLMISSDLGFNMGPILASVGIVGVAIGFGAQSLVKDVISGFFILLEDQYGVGDVIKVGDHSGVVERMSLRATVLRNIEGQVHVIPNGNIQIVSVLTKEWSRAVVDVTVGYSENLDKVFRVLESIGDRLRQDWPERLSEKPNILGIEKMNQDGITIRCMAKTPPTKQWEVMREWRRRIKEEFDRQNIELSTVQRTVLIQPAEAPIQEN